MLPGPVPLEATVLAAQRALEGLRLHRPIARFVLSKLSERTADLVPLVGSAPLLALRALRSVAAAGAPVASLREAVDLLGDKDTRCLLEGMALHALGRDSESWRPVLWRHAVEVAHAARLLAHDVPRIDGDTAYAIALLHDLGAFALSAMHPERYASYARRFAEREDPIALREERATFGCDHGTLGGACLRAWQLPEVVCQAVELHPLVRVVHAEHSTPARTYAALVAVGEALTQQVRMGLPEPEVVRWTLADPLAGVLGLTAPTILRAAQLLPVEVALLSVEANQPFTPRQRRTG